MKYETFEKEFKELSTSERIAIFNEFCLEHGDADNALYPFDEDFFNTFFSNPMEAARATFFGNIESWSDDYIHFNGYGNLESMSEYEVLGEIEYHLEEIFDHPDVWETYIDPEDDDGEEEE